jgi:2-haloacid dehalogenase
MQTTLAFDVYGTLIDPFGISTRLRDYVGDQAPQFAQIWRDKQIEYLFRRALMQEYQDFPTCTRQALEFTNKRLQTELADGAKAMLMDSYRELPPYPDVAESLAMLKAANCRMYAFSNGHPDDLDHLLEQAGLGKYLDGIISVHDVRSYKPDPAVYRHFLDSTTANAQHTWLISGNPFDVIGAQAVGWNTAWLKRDPAAVFDPWDVEPTATISDLAELVAAL